MTKHTALTRTTMIAALFLTLIGLGSCTKHTTQVVDQGFSAVYTIHKGDWKLDTYTGTTNPPSPLNWYATNLSVPEIDDRIVASGAVIVYLSFDGGDTYEALPEELTGVTYNSLHSVGNVYIGFRSIDGSQPSLPSGDVLAKVVILDATPLD
jgi:hypothetical protein